VSHLSLLRASGEFTNTPYELGAVMQGDGFVGVAAGDDLIAFAGAAVQRDDGAILRNRKSIIHALGMAAMLDAAAVIGGFDGITRIADATGIPLEPKKANETADFRARLAIDRFQGEKW
jgi:hypothetical protein